MELRLKLRENRTGESVGAELEFSSNASTAFGGGVGRGVVVRFFCRLVGGSDIGRGFV